MSGNVDVTPGVEQWMALSDALLAGLVHAMNNRVTALSVCAELAALGDEEMLSGGVLTGEVNRLQRTSALIGLLPARAQLPEALELRPVLDDAIALHAHHPRMRSIECTLNAHDAMQPLRAPRWALLRLLLILVDAAKESVAESASRTTVQLHSDEYSARVRFTARGDGGPYGAAMAALCGATLMRDGSELVLTFPSLLVLRQRERHVSAGG